MNLLKTQLKGDRDGFVDENRIKTGKIGIKKPLPSGRSYTQPETETNDDLPF